MFKRESLGGGDIKLMLIFGLVLGWDLSLITIGFGSLIALPISLVLLKIKKTNIIAFGPYLSAAALIIYYTSINLGMIVDWLSIGG